MTPSRKIAAAIALCFAAAPAWADINVGISVSATGPAASLGIPEKNTAALLPTTVAGQKINYIVLDDATNPTEANKNARKFVTENSADIIFGSSAVPTALAIAEVATETKTPQIALAPVELPEARKAWVFVVPQHNAVMASALRLYTKIGFRRDCDLPPIRGVAYGRYVLGAEDIDAAIARLGS